MSSHGTLPPSVRPRQMLVDVHGGSVPDTWEGLEALPGVGHKTASVVCVISYPCASLTFGRSGGAFAACKVGSKEQQQRSTL